MLRLTIVLATAFVLHGVALAQSAAAAIFLLIEPGAAPAGRGGTGVADATDAFASYWNPAALAFLPQREVVYQRTPWLPGGLVDDIVYNFLGIRYNLPGRGTLGGHIIYLDLGEQERRDENNEILGTFRSNMAAFTLSFATKMSPLSSVGFNAKIIYQNQSSIGSGGEGGKGSSTDFAFDIAYYRRQFGFNRLDLGLAVSNVGHPIAFIDDDQADLSPTNMKLGIKWRVVETEINRVALLYDMNKLLVASYPNIDYDGNGIIGGYDSDGAMSPGGEYGAGGEREAHHTDPWYLALFTSWFDDWLFGGDVDRDGDGIIGEEEVGNKGDGSIRDELRTLTHNVGLEFWPRPFIVLRTGLMYDGLGKVLILTFGVGTNLGGFRLDVAYRYGESGHPLRNVPLSLNWAF